MLEASGKALESCAMDGGRVWDPLEGQLRGVLSELGDEVSP
jgi:hypothetical protein